MLKKITLSLVLAASSLPVLAETQPQIAHDSFTGALSGGLGTVDTQAMAFSGRALMAAATGISYFQTFSVASPSTGGWEYPSATQTTTTYNHGGGFIDVAVLQYGYGNETGGRINGTAGTKYNTEIVCGTLSTLHYCSAGETITGWIYYYEFTGSTGGFFDATAYSTASPFGNASDSITIL